MKAKTERTDPLQEKLLNECYELLEINEQFYTAIIQPLEYAEDYARTNTWDSLLKARASASAALAAIRRMELPVFDLTPEEIDLLAAEKIEANEVQREFETLEDTRASKADMAALFCYTLEDDVFMRASVENAIPDMVNFYQDYFTLEYRYTCLFLNYMMIQMDAEGIWQTWIEQFPCMADCADTWYSEAVDVKEATDKVLDEMQTMQTQMENFLGISQFTLEIVQEAVETGNMEVLRREVNVIEGVPGYFPIPAWLTDAVNWYLVTDTQTKEKRLVTAGEELTDEPSACYISCGRIPVEDVQEYELLLKKWSIETCSSWNEGMDTWQLRANCGNSCMMIEWREDETLLYLTEPVGCLIPEIYLYAMNME